MVTDWKLLGRQLGCFKEDGSEIGGNDFAEAALEKILGPDWIIEAVDHILTFKLGSELAMSCLRLICSLKATEYAYKLYKCSTGEKADRAVWIMKEIAHPDSLEWVEEFLDDVNVAQRGIRLLDQLVYRNNVKDTEKLEYLLNKAGTMYNGAFESQVEFIRSNHT